MVDTYTLTSNKQIIKPDNNTYVNNWSTPVNSDWDIIDKAFGNQVAKSSTGLDIPLSISDIQNQRVKIEGTLSNSIVVTIPFIDGSTSLAVGGMWVFDNETTNNYTVTVKTIVSGSVGVVLTQGKRSLVYSDGTNCYFADDRAAGIGDQPTGGGTNRIFFTNDLTVTDDFLIPADKNAMTAGPITVNSGVTVTVQPTSTWTIV
jgi:hypothetical protein